MKAGLRERLACPRCRTALSEWRAGRTRCTSCGAQYVSDGSTPVLLPPQHTAPEESVAGGSGWVAARRRVGDLMAPIGVGRVYKSRRLRHHTEDFLNDLSPGAVVLNVGAGTTSYGPAVLNLEIAPGPEIDVVGVGEALPFRDCSLDGVLLEAVLEHVPDADSTLREIHRVLRPGGRVYVDVPFIQGYHACPQDFRRFTELGLRQALEAHGIAVSDTGVSAGPASAMSWVTGEFLTLVLSGPRGRGRRVVRPLAGLLSAPIRLLDEWLDGHPHAATIASGVWAIGVRG